MEQALAQRTETVLLHTHCTGALAHDGHVFRVAAKGSNVVLHPLNGRQLIVQAVVAGKAGLLLQLGQAHKAHGPQTVVQRHANDPMRRPDRAIKMLFVAAATGKTAAVDVDEHRQLVALFGCFRRKNIQEQAVLVIKIGFALAELVVIEELLFILFLVVKGPGLIGTGTVLRGFVNALPMGDGHRVFPATGRCIADALIRSGTGNSARCALHIAAGGMNDIFHNFSLLLFWERKQRHDGCHAAAGLQIFTLPRQEP